MPLSPPTTEAAVRLRRLFAGAGYDGVTIARRLHATGEPIYSHRDLVVHRRRLAAEPDALAALLTLLMLGDPLPSEQAERLLGDDAPPLLEAGLVEERDGELHGLVRVVPHDDLLVASDRLVVETPDRVAGVHRPSAALAHLTIRRPVERALDVGTGNGIQALLLSRHAERVVATDVNERALRFAEFNLALNGVDNVELRAGSLLEPAAGERFGCVVANPPYVISPDSLYVFRDSGLPGDAISETLARGLPDVLEPGGFATLMASWAQAGGDPAARPREWLDDRSDAWILHTTTDDPLSNAAVWNRDAVDDLDELAATIDRWTAYYREQGIEALAYGALVLRRREGGGGWSRAVGLPPRALEPASAHLLRMFAGVDAAEAGADALLGLRVTPARSVRFQQVVSPHDGWTVTSAALELHEGLGFRADVDEPTLLLLRALDGSVTAREAVVATLGEDAVDEAATILRGMVETGFLAPADERIPIARTPEEEGAAVAAPSDAAS